MVSLASVRKQLDQTKEKLRELQRMNAEQDARREASQIFKTLTKEDGGGRDSLPSESSVFADGHWVQPTSDPPNCLPICRETYVDSLGGLLGDVLRGGVGRNVFIVGRPGTGKTLTARFVLTNVAEQVAKNRLSVGLRECGSYAESLSNVG